MLRLQYVLTGAAVVCVAVIALLLVHTLGDNEISGPGGNAGSALLASGGNAFAAAGEEAAQMAVPVPSEDATAGQGKMETTKCQTM